MIIRKQGSVQNGGWYMPLHCISNATVSPNWFFIESTWSWSKDDGIICWYNPNEKKGIKQTKQHN